MDFTGQRETDLRHHLELGLAWLSKSKECEGSIAASYAAFEFRLALERLAFQYWFRLEGESLSIEDAQKASMSLKRMEKFIYKIAGNQQQINRRFDLIRIFYDELKVEKNFATPQIGKLSAHWHTCSDYCHIGWTIFQEALEDRLEVYANLDEVADYLTHQIEGFISWPKLPQTQSIDLQKIAEDYVEGAIEEEVLRKAMREKGIWAKVVYTDGRPSEFVGRAVPPNS